MADFPAEVIETINTTTTHDTIPQKFMIGSNGWLYKLVEKKVGSEKMTVEVLISSTPPFITKQYTDIETGEFLYQLTFNRAGTTYNLLVNALDVADATHMINLVAKGFDVTTSNRAELVGYIANYQRLNPLDTIKSVGRLGHIKSHFIHPLLLNGDVELTINDPAHKDIANQFKIKGTLQQYADNVFRLITASVPTMMMLYASCGSILLHDFDVEPFIIDLSGATSRGKTTALKCASSVWGTQKLINEWNITAVAIERKASFLNSFPLLLDDTRKATPYMLPDVIYQFTGGREKGRGTITSFKKQHTWQNIMISTGEVCIVDYNAKKAGVAARVVTLQNDPFNNVSFIDLYKGINSQYGTLGLAFIEQYHEKKDVYYRSFKSHEKRLIEKAGGNEIMLRIARPFALLQVAGEIINDIDGFEHDPYITIDKAYNSMLTENANIDKPKQLLNELLQYLDANRNNIEGDGYYNVAYSDVKAIYKRDFLLIMGETLKQFLGHELNTITKQWHERGYLITDKERLTKRVSHKNAKMRGYAIKKDIVNKLGFDFNQGNLFDDD